MYLTIGQDFDIVLTGVDKIINKNKINKSSLKSLEIGEKPALMVI